MKTPLFSHFHSHRGLTSGEQYPSASKHGVSGGAGAGSDHGGEGLGGERGAGGGVAGTGEGGKGGPLGLGGGPLGGGGGRCGELAGSKGGAGKGFGDGEEGGGGDACEAGRAWSDGEAARLLLEAGEADEDGGDEAGGVEGKAGGPAGYEVSSCGGDLARMCCSTDVTAARPEPPTSTTASRHKAQHVRVSTVAGDDGSAAGETRA